MPGLTATLWMAERSLMANQGALNVTTNNIANANTPGYTREEAILESVAPSQDGNLLYGNGVQLDSIRSVRDQVLELRIAQEMQQQSSAQAQYNALQQVQALFANPSQGIGNDVTAFFNSLNQLSVTPSSIAARQAVLTAADNLTSDFHSTESNLNTIQNGLNQSVSQTVAKINSLTDQIAQLNGQVGLLQQQGQDGGALLDQENQLIQDLSQLTDVNVIQTEAGLTVTTSSGIALVAGHENFALQSSTVSGTQHVFAQGQDVTGTFQGGQLAGVLAVRDQVIPGLLNQLDNFAYELSSSINTAQQSGFDLAGNNGQPFFACASGAGAASSFQLAISDPSLIAASSDGSPGSNGNLANFLAVQTQALPSGADPIDTYATLVSQAGNLTSQAASEVSSSTSSLNHLNDLRGALSSVSIDEETTKLLTYQRAYQAAARIVTTVDELTQTILQMGAN